MAELGCSAVNCVYNKEELCCKGDILVGGRTANCSDETCCESFSDRKYDSFSNTTATPYQNISIDCEAENCKYNRSMKCTAAHVDIREVRSAGGGNTLCATFIEA